MTPAPAVNGAEIANLAAQTGSGKWFFQTADESDPSDAANACQIHGKMARLVLRGTFRAADATPQLS